MSYLYLAIVGCVIVLIGTVGVLLFLLSPNTHPGIFGVLAGIGAVLLLFGVGGFAGYNLFICNTFSETKNTFQKDLLDTSQKELYNLFECRTGYAYDALYTLSGSSTSSFSISFETITPLIDAIEQIKIISSELRSGGFLGGDSGRPSWVGSEFDPVYEQNSGDLFHSPLGQVIQLWEFLIGQIPTLKALITFLIDVDLRETWSTITTSCPPFNTSTFILTDLSDLSRCVDVDNLTQTEIDNFSQSHLISFLCSLTQEKLDGIFSVINATYYLQFLDTSLRNDYLLAYGNQLAQYFNGLATMLEHHYLFTNETSVADFQGAFSTLKALPCSYVSDDYNNIWTKAAEPFASATGKAVIFAILAIPLGIFGGVCILMFKRSWGNRKDPSEIFSESEGDVPRRRQKSSSGGSFSDDGLDFSRPLKSRGFPGVPPVRGYGSQRGQTQATLEDSGNGNSDEEAVLASINSGRMRSKR